MWPALNAKLLTDAAETYNFRLGRPVPLAVTRDGAVLFRRTPPRSFAADLYELDTKTGQVKTLLSASAGEEHLSDAEKARRERSRTATRGVVDIDVSDDGHIVMAALDGKLQRIDRSTGTRTEIDPGDAYDPHLSPDGKLIAFVRDGDIWVTDGGKPRQLTKHPEGIEYGTADFAAQEELDRTRGFGWSPDSTRIIYQTTDTRQMDTIYVADARHPDKTPVPFKYPRAGTNNAKLGIAVVGIDGKPAGEVRWDTEKYPYLARATWQANTPVTIVVLNREQTELSVIAYDEKWQAKELIHEHDDAWINVATNGGSFGHDEPGAPIWKADGSSFLWMTESQGDDWSFAEYDRDGKRSSAQVFNRANGKGLRGITGFDGNDLIVELAGSDPMHSVVARVTQTSLELLSTEDGVSAATVQNGVVVVTTGLAKGGVKTVAISKQGTFELPSVAVTPSLVPTTKFETVQLEGRTHYCTVTRPQQFDPAKKYPVILSVYGGPHAQYVDAQRDRYVMDQWYADAGFIVVRSDNRGTPYRGRAWERAILKDLITIPMADQVGALQALGANHPEMDMTRVGVTGWSFGGYFSLMAVLLRPDVFKAAVAGAPVTDWKLYDTAYTERYMREPKNNEAGYAKTSALTYAKDLSRKLLVIHGITDDNVHFAHTLALIEALYVAGKRAEVITLSSTHMVPDPKLNFAREQVQVEFFRENL